MVREPRIGFAVRALAALLLALAGSWAHAASDSEARVKEIAARIQYIKDLVDRATSDLDLNGILGLVANQKRQQQEEVLGQMATALQKFTTHKNKAKEFEGSIKTLKTQIENEKAGTGAPQTPSSEEQAVEANIASDEAALKALLARRRLPAELEAQIATKTANMPPAGGFMNAGPIEALQEQLKVARTNVPSQADFDKALAELERDRTELRKLHASRPKTAPSQVPQLEAKLKTAEEGFRTETESAELAKKEFQRARAQVAGLIELYSWLEVLVANRREELAKIAKPGQCESTLGPIHCTGAFVGTWSSSCTSPGGSSSTSGGSAQVFLRPDGTIEVRMVDAKSPGEKPNIVNGGIKADGSVLIQRSDPGSSEIYKGQFSLVPATMKGDAARLAGGGTYEYRSKDSEGKLTFSCSGSMKLN